MNEEVLAAFDALFEAGLKRKNPDAAASLFADGDVVLWGSGANELALGRAGVAELLGQHRRDRRRSHLRVEAPPGDRRGRRRVGDRARRPDLQPAGHGVQYRLAAVFVRRGGRWLWHTFSGSEPVG